MSSCSYSCSARRGGGRVSPGPLPPVPGSPAPPREHSLQRALAFRDPVPAAASTINRAGKAQKACRDGMGSVLRARGHGRGTHSCSPAGRTLLPSEAHLISGRLWLWRWLGYHAGPGAPRGRGGRGRGLQILDGRLQPRGDSLPAHHIEEVGISSSKQARTRCEDFGKAGCQVWREGRVHRKRGRARSRHRSVGARIPAQLREHAQRAPGIARPDARHGRVAQAAHGLRSHPWEVCYCARF